MKMTMNPLNKPKAKPEVKAALREIQKEGEYRFNILIDRRTMASYQHLCKIRGVKVQAEIKGFIDRQLKQFDDLMP